MDAAPIAVDEQLRVEALRTALHLHAPDVETLLRHAEAIEAWLLREAVDG